VPEAENPERTLEEPSEILPERRPSVPNPGAVLRTNPLPNHDYEQQHCV
jgi:hypothetical protein